MIPLRIVDTAESVLAGYIYLFLTKVSFGGKSCRTVMLGGIEPRSSWLSRIDEYDFYIKVKELLISKTKEMGAALLSCTTNKIAHTNCRKLMPVISADLSGKPVVRCSGTLSFPAGIYDISEMAVLWTRGNIIPVSD